MGSQDIPAAPPTPDPIPQEVTDASASDLLSRALKRRKGRRASFLTKGQKAATGTKSLLGGNQEQL